MPRSLSRFARDYLLPTGTLVAVLVLWEVAYRVFKIEGGVAKKVAFRAGLTSWERTEVLSGLSENDQVIATLNVRDLDDGKQVKVRQVLDPPSLAEPRPDQEGGQAARSNPAP